MELAVKPLQLGRRDVADEYEILLTHFPYLTLIDLDQPTMRRAAELRALYRLGPADALHIAACLGGEATAFVTNVTGLKRVVDLDIVILADYLDQGDGPS